MGSSALFQPMSVEKSCKFVEERKGVEISLVNPSFQGRCLEMPLDNIVFF